MVHLNSEPTIDEIMRDPTVKALMKADRVDAGAFEAKLRGLARAASREPADRERTEPLPSGGRISFPLALAIRSGAERCCRC